MYADSIPVERDLRAFYVSTGAIILKIDSKVESVQYPKFDCHRNDYILSTLTTILPTLTLISAGVLFPAQLLAITLTL